MSVSERETGYHSLLAWARKEERGRGEGLGHGLFSLAVVTVPYKMVLQPVLVIMQLRFFVEEADIKH